MEKVKKIVEDYRSIPLSDHDLLKMMKNKANLVTYPEISEYSSIDELLGRHDVCFILYLWKPNYGHWCCITRHDNLIEFFDPFGGYIDDCLADIPEPFRTQSGQRRPALTDLLLKCKYNLSYNEFQFQKYDDNISTCGRWSVLRGLLKNLTLQEFTDLFLNEYGDYIATVITS